MEHLGITNAEDPSGESGEQIPVSAPLSGVVLREADYRRKRRSRPACRSSSSATCPSLWALAEIDETVLPHVKAGETVDVRVAAYPGETFTGTIAWVSDMVNPKTRRVTVRCALPNPDSRLKPEMYATVSLGEGEPHPVVVVPSGAVQDIDGRRRSSSSTTGDGRFARRDVHGGAANATGGSRSARACAPASASSLTAPSCSSPSC